MKCHFFALVALLLTSSCSAISPYRYQVSSLEGLYLREHVTNAYWADHDHIEFIDAITHDTLSVPRPYHLTPLRK
jgi:hypothetical protein